MKQIRGSRFSVLHQTGLTLVELIVSIAISLTIMSGVVQVLVVSKSNFVTERELATLQENARFALKFMSDEIRLAGYNGCSSRPYQVAKDIKGHTGYWYLNDPGLQGYEYDAGTSTFPTDFRSDVRANTDAVVVRRGKPANLRMTAHSMSGGTAGTITVSAAHSYQRGQVFLIAKSDCAQLGMFQMSGPANASNAATTIEHKTGVTAVPGNGTVNLHGSYSYNAAGTITGTSAATAYPITSLLMEMVSEAFYVGNSTTDSTVPALFRERMLVNAATYTPYTAAEELVQGIENMQVLYGYDADNNGLADRYMKANDSTFATATNWNNVVSVRLTVRMRSIYPVYNKAMSYGTFEGISGTSGSDAYMRQTLSTTIMMRNN